MKNNNKILAISVFLILVFAMAQLIGSASAATEKVVDKGIAPYKNNKYVKLNWTAKIYKNNKLEVYRSFSKNNKVYKIKKTIFKRINKGKLKVSILERYNSTTTRTNRYIKIKKSQSLKSYYFNIYQVKILKNIAKSKVFDSGSGYLSNIAHGSINWKARVYYNGKVSIKEDISGINSYATKKIVERSSKGKLRVTKYTYDDIYDYKTDRFVKRSTKSVTYVKSNLSPKNYYLKVYRSKMLKYLSDHSSGCIEMVHISPKSLVYTEVAYGNLNNSSGKMEWTINGYYSGKVVIIRNYTDSSFLNSTTTIEQFNKTALKISVVYNNGNSSELRYVNYSSDPYQYFLNIYRPEMLKLIKGNVTIVKNESHIALIAHDTDYS